MQLLELEWWARAHDPVVRAYNASIGRAFWYNDCCQMSANGFKNERDPAPDGELDAREWLSVSMICLESLLEADKVLEIRNNP